MRIHGKEKLPEPPFIVTSNHTSLLDPPLVGIACKKYCVDFMAKKELFDMPVVGIWSKLVNCIEVKRGENSIKSLKEAMVRLKKGHVVGIFPEGTRSSDGEIGDAKRGIGFLIAKSGVPVVPCYVEGSGRAMPKGKPVKKGAKIDVYVGNAIMPVDLMLRTESGKVDYENISRIIMERITDIKLSIEST
ncbi:MAG: lysophospholipid acyltransferase family protein [Candidatus Omnitrophota bacterium]